MLDVEVDDELLAQYRWHYICLFMLQASTQEGRRAAQSAEFLSQVQRAEKVRLSWIAIMDENAWEGPFFYLILTGIKAPFRHHVLRWNQTSGHCHVLHSDLKA
jgi:hypothetical protein